MCPFTFESFTGSLILRMEVRAAHVACLVVVVTVVDPTLERSMLIDAAAAAVRVEVAANPSTVVQVAV